MSRQSRKNKAEGEMWTPSIRRGCNLFFMGIKIFFPYFQRAFALMISIQGDR